MTPDPLSSCSWAELRQKLAQALKERDHWKANHDEMVARNAILRTRPDLTAEQVAERLGYIKKPWTPPKLKLQGYRLVIVRDSNGNPIREDSGSGVIGSPIKRLSGVYLEGFGADA